MLASSVRNVNERLSAQIDNVPMVLCGTLKFTIASVTRVRLSLPGTPGKVAICSRGNGGMSTRLVSCASKGTHVLMRTAIPTAKCIMCSVHASKANTDGISAGIGALRGSLCGVALSGGKSVISLASGGGNGRLIGTKGTVHLTLFARGGSCG